MARANVARRQGDDFQARLFWLRAARLLDDNRPTVRVAYEKGPKSFDDIFVEYDWPRAPLDHDGNPIARRHIQAKWHTTAGTFGYQDLANPAFIGASRYSLLQKAKNVVEAFGAAAGNSELRLVTNWRILADDPLLDLVRKEADAIDLARLFDGTSDRSRMGRVRKFWRDHLGVDDEGLQAVLRAFRIAEASESLASLRSRLNDRFAAVGMKVVPDHETGFLYDDLIVKLLAQGRIEFDRDGFRAMCAREGLLEQQRHVRLPLTLGIRSFMHPIDDLEDRCDRVLNLVPWFEGRYIRNPGDWQSALLPELRNFVLGAAREIDKMRLVLDTHVSLAFAVGALLNVKSGKCIEIEQRTAGRRFWSPNDASADSNWPKLAMAQETLAGDGDEVAVAISLTHDVSPSVRRFAADALPQAARIIRFSPDGAPSQQSVKCGAHAWKLAESVIAQLRSLNDGADRPGRAHIFIAGPNAFSFFLGQLQQGLGAVSLYEWDFEGQRGGGYSLGLSFGS